jgi:hypothetical protein
MSFENEFEKFKVVETGEKSLYQMALEISALSYKLGKAEAALEELSKAAWEIDYPNKILKNICAILGEYFKGKE